MECMVFKNIVVPSGKVSKHVYWKVGYTMVLAIHGTRAWYGRHHLE
jgi:hypothetical protein